MQQRTRIQTDPTVSEGGTIHMRVDGGPEYLTLIVPGLAPVRVRVVRGRAEYQVPPHVRGGSHIFITDDLFPNPTGTSVLVVGGNSR
jgi:hypothetical protein